MNDSLSRHAVYCGSFDPLTLGHCDIIRRGARLFDQLTVGIGTNPDKRSLFSPDERLRLTKETLADLDGVDVRVFDGLAVDFVRSLPAAIMLRGIRSLSDTEAEFTMSLANSVLAPDIETVFLMASEKYTHISSTLIKQIASMASDKVAEKLSSFVPTALIQPLLERYAK